MRKIICGADHFCAIDSNRRLLCWGQNDGGQLGDGSLTAREMPGVVAFEGAVDASAWADKTCVVAAAGDVLCVGGYGAGRGEKALTWTSANLPGPARQISLGEWISCALLEDDRVACWEGWGPPEMVASLADATGVSVGHRHACAVRRSGTVACWGFDGGFGTLGVETMGTGLERTVSPPIEEVVQVSAGGFHTCAVRKSGRVSCWGDRRYLGAPWTISEPGWEDLTTLSTITRVSAGTSYTCALDQQGAVYCWGERPDHPVTPALAAPDQYAQVAACGSRICGILADGLANCWTRQGGH